jgi:2-polyprenyl-3-methyl-5-hydroxy-6-metoxy-1,4-benzoquinol methylase/uncharacterized protein YbaR (Trm112 family)
MNEFLLGLLVDPVDKSRLRIVGDALQSESGRVFPIVQGVPIMLVDGVDQTIRVAERTLSAVKRRGNSSDPWQLETTVIDPGKLPEVKRLLSDISRQSVVDPVVNHLVGKTGGYLYRQLAGHLESYPVPEIPVPSLSSSASRSLLDIGCSWGRWSLSAAKKGYSVVGIDPSLGAVLAGNRVAEQLGLTVHWVVGDARYLPFKEGSFDQVFSYSVLQHFSESDVRAALVEVGRVLGHQGASMIQMPNRYGIRSLYHQWRRKFREAERFEVRYYTPMELMNLFQATVGPSKLSVEGFFGLGVQIADASMMPMKNKVVIHASEILRRAAKNVPSLASVADSLYVESKKTWLH